MGRNPYYLWLVLTVVAICGLTAHFYFKIMAPKNQSITEIQDVVINEIQAREPTQQIPQSKVDAQKSAPSKVVTTQARSLDELNQALGTKLNMDVSSDGYPFRLSGVVSQDKLRENGESELQAALRYVNIASQVLGIDRLDQLTPPTERQPGALGGIYNFMQSYEGIPVEGGQVRVLMDQNGNPFMVNSTYIPKVSGISTTPRLTAEQAAAVATNHARNLDPNRKQPDVSDPVKVIYRFQDTSTDLAWKVVVRQYWLGGVNAVGIYYVSANDETRFERVRGSFQ